MKMQSQRQPENVSVPTLRKTLGVLGLFLPFILLIGSGAIGGLTQVQRSVSMYYYTNMGDVLVGVLLAYGLFLFAYKGYDRIDYLLAKMACLFSLGVALCPCDHPNPIISNTHFISAILLFLIFTLFSLFRFPKTGKTEPTPEKIKRNIIYRVCGIVMLLSMVLMGVYFAFLVDETPAIDKLQPVFWLEAILLVAFGISWLLKGEFFLKDKEPELNSIGNE